MSVCKVNDLNQMHKFSVNILANNQQILKIRHKTHSTVHK